MSASGVLPRWAPRVKQAAIRELYQNDAAGLVDEELIDAVGYALLARCQSFIAANQAVEGLVYCPVCAAPMRHKGRKEEMLACACGWQLTWQDYFKTIQHMQLSGAEPVRAQFRTYIDEFPRTRTPQEKIFLIDRLIHGFHYYFKNNAPTRPVAINLIEGRLPAVIALLDGLSYGPGSTPGTAEHRAAWQAKLAASWLGASRDRQPDVQDE